MTVTLTLCVLPSPIGPLAVACDGEGRVRGAGFDGDRPDGLRRTMRREWPEAEMAAGAAPDEVRRAVADYFDGDRAALARVPWTLDGAAGAFGFPGRVWRLLAEVPAGATISYGETARRAGEPGAAQAAGVALNRNPIPLILPCHRVVGADGSMTGFGGGLERKTWLLAHEGALLL
ncbi:MAG TPA: methylated-DNA--[protein]-cysteine S-methyltransferase [Brevundimonas sp.]|uniref:methylated-DNA--[protein]-cysteine S-methyltransferase n=1 Tax=Brevundimonas sp. TaxID=1871086 RepID=UPI002DE27BB5|nr:methylated-DNA--[protein]-cysteine S-methyltransferase [Brevundimonas sp.]